MDNGFQAQDRSTVQKQAEDECYDQQQKG